jgi:formate C-acetyltransferase
VPQTGPVSVVRDFAGAVIPEVCNGGPLTIELHDSVFREPDGIGKVVSLVQLFCKSGGHQLQLNAIDRETLVEAQKYPELHRDLIVRVWGWSGYFVELDKVFQDHIIRRTGLSFR